MVILAVFSISLLLVIITELIRGSSVWVVGV